MAKIKKDLKHIHKDQLSDRIQKAIDQNGFSIYRDVLIVWGISPDKKIIELLDKVVDKYPNQLLVVHFEDNLLEMVWKDGVPLEFDHKVVETEGGRIEMVPYEYFIPVIF